MNTFIALSMVVFAVVALIGVSSRKPYVVLAVAGVLLSAVLFASGRSVAVPALCLSLLYLPLAFLIPKLRSRTPRFILGGTALLCSIVVSTLLFLFASHIQFPAPEGEYPIGVRAAEISDINRGNAWNAIDESPRRILIRVWYPAEKMKAGGSRVRNLPAEKAHTGEMFDALHMKPLKVLSQALAEVETHAHWDAPALEREFPLLVFSHGYFGPINSNAMLMEQLASQGYIVVSITHPNESSELVYLDGTQLPLSPRAAEAQEEIVKAASGTASMDMDQAAFYSFLINFFEPGTIIGERVPVWAVDFSAVLDALKARDYVGDINTVISNVDFDHVGFLGMSAGAATAPLACYNDDRCDAVAGLDVGGGSGDLRDVNLQKPALIFDGGFPARMGGQDLYYEEHCSLGTATDIVRVTLPGAAHWDFTDFALSLSKFGKSLIPRIVPLLGPVDGESALLIQSRLLTQFFDIYLKQEQVPGYPDNILDQTNDAELADLTVAKQWIKKNYRDCSLPLDEST